MFLTKNRNLLFDNQIHKQWFSTKEAAEFLSVSPNALRIMVHRGTIKAHKLGGRLRFSISDLLAIIQPMEEV